MIKNIITLTKVFMATLFIVSCSSDREILDSTQHNNQNFSGENNARFGLRNLQSGLAIVNVPDERSRDIVGWDLISIDVPEQDTSKYPGGWVAFNVPGTDKCLALLNSNSLGRAPCDSSGNIAVFTLIPSTTGAVQIKSVRFGTCIQDVEPGTDKFTMGKCIEDPSNPMEIVPERSLWMLNPPSSESTVTPLSDG
ncbi:RICIN domain-containing protein [Vibrio cholerae]|uniref:toxin n=1 Tax=Vibrio cholerae TaxID=666 RepID=UPI000AD75012|nr:toxin [Vibrio cholerae]